MDIKKLQETRIVSKEGHFLPVIVVDLGFGVPAAFAAGATFAGREIKTEWNNRKNKYTPVPQLVPYRTISLSEDEKGKLINSIDDIQF